MPIQEFTGELDAPAVEEFTGELDQEIEAREKVGGFKASAKQAIGSTIKGAGQAAADFIPGVDQDNALKRYGQEVVDANPTAVRGFQDIADKPLTTVTEATGNAAGSMAGMVGARLVGQGVTAASPLAGPFAPAVAAVGQAISWLGPVAIAALPSFGGIRDKQILNNPENQESAKSKAVAALGAAAVGAIETRFGPQNWALAALTKEGRAKLAEKFAATTLTGSVAKAAATGAAVEGAEELVQNPIEQIAAGDDPTTREALSETAFGGVMGAVGGGVLGGGIGAGANLLPAPAPAPQLTPREELLHKTAESVIAKAHADERITQPTKESQDDRQNPNSAASEAPADANETNAEENAQATDEALLNAPNLGTIAPNMGAVENDNITPVTVQTPASLVGDNAVLAPKGDTAPKTVGGIRVSAQSTEQLQAIAQSPETPATTRHAAVAAIQARNPEARPAPPVAESQAPATSEPGNRGVAPAQEGGLPDSSGFIAAPNGYFVRISRHTAGSNVLDPTSDVGAFVYEVRKGREDRNPLTMVVNKDGKLVTIKSVLDTSDKSNGTAWVPNTSEAMAEVASLLNRRAQTATGSSERAAIDARIKSVVTNDASSTGGAETAATPGEQVRDLALQTQKEAGWNSSWPFVPADLLNADFRDLIRNDPSLDAKEKEAIFSAGRKLGVVPANDASPAPPQNVATSEQLTANRNIAPNPSQIAPNPEAIAPINEQIAPESAGIVAPVAEKATNVAGKATQEPTVSPAQESVVQESAPSTKRGQAPALNAPAVAKPRQVETTAEESQQPNRLAGAGKEIERFQGQYKKGMSERVAKQQQKRLSSAKPGLTWTVEKTTIPEFPDRFDVVGRTISETVKSTAKSPKAQASTQPPKVASPALERRPAPTSQEAPTAAQPATPAATMSKAENVVQAPASQPANSESTKVRVAEIDAELTKLQAQYEKKMKGGPRNSMVPPSIKGDVLKSITDKMDKLDAEKAKLLKAAAPAKPSAEPAPTPEAGIPVSAEESAPAPTPAAEKAPIAAEKAAEKAPTVAEMSPADLLRAAADKLEGKPSAPATPAPESAAKRSEATTIADRTINDIRAETKQKGVWIGDLEKNGDLFPVRLTFKGTNRADYYFDIYADGKVTDSIPFPAVTGRKTVQEASDILLDYVRTDNTVDKWVMRNIGQKQARLQEPKTEPEQAATGKDLPWDKADLATLAELKRYTAKKYKTANDEKQIELLTARIHSDPSKWAAGDGVGYHVARQINRGFQVAEVDAENKMARIVQVADTGLTSTGGDNDRIKPQWVHISELVRDRKYDNPNKPNVGTSGEVPPVLSQKEGRIGDKNEGETDKGTALFARRPITASDSRMSAAVTMLAEMDDLFQQPTPTGKTVAGIANEINPEYKIKEAGRSMVRQKGAIRGWEVTVPNSPVRGGEIYEDGKRVWLNVSRLIKGQDTGNTIYGIAAAYAHNTGKVLIGDPDGLSQTAYYRRTENMLSSALKFGTTDHLEPHEGQTSPETYFSDKPDFADKTVSMQWKQGDTAFNLRELLKASYNNTVRSIPEIKNVYYNFAAQRFETSDANGTREFTDADFKSLAGRTRAMGGSNSVGSATEKRAALLNTFARGTSKEAWGRILAAISAQLSGRGLDQNLQGTFYARTQGEQGGITESTLRTEIAKAFGPKATAMVGDILIPLETQAEIANVSELTDVVPLIREGDLISGFYHPATGKTYAILENLTPEGVKGLALHEIGVHYGLEGMLGKERYAQLSRQLDAMRKAGNKVVIEAYRQATEQAAKPNQVPEETIAYLVTNRPELPFVQRLISQIKAFLFRKFGILGNKLTADDIAALARASVLHASEGVRNGEPQFMVAWHGSPYDYDQFSLHKIGTGEGAQAYGWGLYFASNRAVAEHYRDALSSNYNLETLSATKGERTLTGSELLTEYYKPGSVIQVYGGAYDKVISFDPETGNVVADRYLDKALTKRDPYQRKATYSGSYWVQSEVRNALVPKLKADGWTFKSGKLYQVDLAPQEDEYLDWDKPLSEQSEKVRVALAPVIEQFRQSAKESGPEWGKLSDPNEVENIVDGESIYRHLTEEAATKNDADLNNEFYADTPQESASRYLASIGIPGIRYLDGSSRNKGEGNHNFVIFDDNLVKIEAKFSRNVQGGAMAGAEINAPDWVKALPADMQETLRKAGAWKPKETLQERFAGWTAGWQQKLKQGMVDQFDPIKSLDYHAYMLARMSKSSAGPLESALFDGTVFIDKDGAVDVNYEKGGFIGRMQALKGEHDRFFAWVIGNRAERLMTEGREHNFTKDDIARLKTLNRGKMGDESSREITYAKALADLNRYNKSILDIAQKAGLIDGESRPFWEKDFYIPFYRMTDGDTTKGPVKSGGLVRQYAFKTLKGGEQAIGDPMENILKNWAHLIDASLKNQAGVASLHAAVKAGVARKTTADEKGAVFVMENGEKTYYAVDDPFVLDAINSLGFSGFSGPAMQVMTSFKRWLTFGVTISPTFRIRNVIRDSISMIGTNPASYNVLDNVLTGWRLTKEDSPSYASMIAGGGVIRFGTLERDGATNIKRIVDSGVDAGTILDNPAKVKAMLKTAYDWWMRTGDRSENVNRAALYQKLRGEGKSHLEASYAARDTMDFSMMGTWSAIRFLAQTVPFFNARLQGLYKLGRGAAEDPRRFAYVVGATALASMALLLAYKDDDDWKQREDFDRESFWWFKIGDKAFRIPKPFEIGALGTLAERGLEALVTDELTGKQFAQRMGAVVGQQLSMNPVPQLFMPMIEMWANKDSFTGRPIESMGMEKLSPSERISPYTTAFAQLAGKNGIVSPVQIDHIINGYFGWLGTHAVATADLALRPVMDMPARPAMRIDDVFAVGDFVRDMPAYQSKYVTRLYEQSREVQQVMADMRAYQKIGATEKAAEILKEQGDKIRLYRLYTHAEKQLTQINQQIKMTQRRPGDADAKRARLDQLYAQKNRVAKLTEQRAQSTQR